MDKPDSYSYTLPPPVGYLIAFPSAFLLLFSLLRTAVWGAFHRGRPSLNGKTKKGADGIKAATISHTKIPHPWVPEELSEDDQVGRVQGEAHVGRRDGQNGHAGLGGILEPLAQLLPLG